MEYWQIIRRDQRIERETRVNRLLYTFVMEEFLMLVNEIEEELFNLIDLTYINATRNKGTYRGNETR
jgi:cytochrome c oxidase assembly factor CtaG